MDGKGGVLVEKNLNCRVIIGVTGPDKGGIVSWWFSRIAVRRAGGRAIRITPTKPASIESFHGLIIGGGADVTPELYGQKSIEPAGELAMKRNNFTYSVLRILFYPLIYFLRKLFSRKTMVTSDHARDTLEYYLVKGAIDRRMPVLGICRGAQLINICMGGSLHQDISGFYAESPQFYTVFPKKTVKIESASRLYQILRIAEIKVNALHRQAIHKPGKDIRVAAREKNQVIQAIEHVVLPFILGVQWHPEYLPQHNFHQHIFRALIWASQRWRRSSRYYFKRR